jgi:hypothetical protein
VPRCHGRRLWLETVDRAGSTGPRAGTGPRDRQSLDDRELPERPAPIEGDGGDLGDDAGQLDEASVAQRRAPAHVPGDVELGVLDPHRVAEPVWDLDDAAPRAGMRSRLAARTAANPSGVMGFDRPETSTTAIFMVCMCAEGVSEYRKRASRPVSSSIVIAADVVA